MQGRYKAATRGTRQVQGVQGGYESATRGARQVQAVTMSAKEV